MMDTNMMQASLITLADGTKVYQTSGHGCRFSDGTSFEPSPEQCESIKTFWSFLQVQRHFSKMSLDACPGIGVSKSTQRIPEEALRTMTTLQSEHTDCIFLVSFMVVAALREMGIRDDFPRWLAANATPETQRETPEKKVWDIQNFSY